MFLIQLCIFTLILLAQFRFSFLTLLSPLTLFFHQQCLMQLPQNSQALPELKALVCAENFSTQQESLLYISSGLIHLFVVSGAHLSLLLNIIKKINKLINYFSKKNQYVIHDLLIFIFLFLYSAACEFNPPVTRSLITLVISFYLRKFKIYWPGHYQILVCGLLTLIINPPWISSLSLQMSWLIALAINLNSEFFISYSVLFKQFIFFIVLLPIIIFFQIPSITIILCNLILTPFLELVLFPLGLLIWFLNFAYPLFDLIITYFKLLLVKLEFSFQIQTAQSSSSFLIINWGLIFLLHLLTHLLLVKKIRLTTNHVTMASPEVLT